MYPSFARFEAQRAYSLHLREKHRRLRAKYIAVVDALVLKKLLQSHFLNSPYFCSYSYNTLAEEAKERSDSSSSEEEEQDDNCCIM